MPSEALAPPLPANDPLPQFGTDSGPASPEEIVFAPAAPCDIQDLVDQPCRALDVEYKSWRNLDLTEDRAELARDLAALANHGGGFVVFGFWEYSLEPDDTDPFRTNCTPDRVASIVQTYLDPPVRCEVVTCMSTAGIVHPVIRVGGHGVTPVCIRQDGPVVGGARLIERGAIYVRKHGPVATGRSIGVPVPQSSKIEIAQEWVPLIRRCVRRDRETLLGIMEATIEGRRSAPDVAQRLLAWHRAARAAFLTLVPRSPVAESLARRHYALSYAFELIRPEQLEHAQLPERLRRTVFEMQTMFRSGWNMFDPPYRRGVQARFVTDPATAVPIQGNSAAGGSTDGASAHGDHEVDFLEAAWLRARNPDETADFWRVSPCGLASIIRGYAEDMAQASPVSPGTCLSPVALTQEVAELVCHARAFARLFNGVSRVNFRCEWWGLTGRELFDPDSNWPHRGPALSDHCVATLQVPIARLAQEWPDTVAHLIAPPLRTVESGLLLDADWVRGQVPRWATPPR